MYFSMLENNNSILMQWCYPYGSTMKMWSKDRHQDGQWNSHKYHEKQQ